MEPDRTLNNTIFSALQDITQADLDALLQFDSPPLTTQLTDNNGACSTQQTLSNGKALPSQLSECSVLSLPNATANDFDLSLRCVDKTNNNANANCSVLMMSTQEIDEIVLNDSGVLRQSQCANAKRHLNQSTLNFAATAQVDSSFERDFALFDNDDDFELPSLDFEFAAQRDVQRKREIENNAKAMPQADTALTQRAHKLHENVHFSCPDAPLHASDANSTQTDSLEAPAEPDEMAVSELVAAQTPTTESCFRDSTGIPDSIQQLYNVIKTEYSDFAFVYALSAQLCQERVPMDCLVELKMALLLSIASISTNTDRPPIPILAIGTDTFLANYLMTHIGQLAERFVGPVDDVKAPPLAQQRDYKWCVATPLVLAKGGVHFVGDWCHLKTHAADKLFKEIECSRITLDQTSNARSYPLQAAVWSHWRTFKNAAKEQQMFNKFVKIFGIPVYMSDDNHESLVNFILEQSSVQVFESAIDNLSITEQDMRDFIQVIKRRTIDLTPDAKSLLQKYFVATRSARPDCLTKQAYVVLKRFAESFAKLSLRIEVLPIDALASIFLCEHCIQNIYGALTDAPPMFKSHNYIGLIDEQLAHFQEWLNAYIEKFYEGD